MIVFWLSRFYKFQHSSFTLNMITCFIHFCDFRYALKNNLPVLNHVSLPRLGAMQGIIDVCGCKSDKVSPNNNTGQSHFMALVGYSTSSDVAFNFKYFCFYRGFIEVVLRMFYFYTVYPLQNEQYLVYPFNQT